MQIFHLHFMEVYSAEVLSMILFIIVVKIPAIAFVYDICLESFSFRNIRHENSSLLRKTSALCRILIKKAHEFSYVLIYLIFLNEADSRRDGS